jgi:hypothetical protein
VLHGCVAFGAQLWFEQVPLLSHAPVELHVCVSVPVLQLPQATACVCPGAQRPVQAPETQVWFTQATGLPHAPLESHVSTPLPEHVVEPGLQEPPQVPPEQTNRHAAPSSCHAPEASHFCGWSPLHRVAFGAHAEQLPELQKVEHGEPFCH